MWLLTLIVLLILIKVYSSLYFLWSIDIQP